MYFHRPCYCSMLFLCVIFSQFLFQFKCNTIVHSNWNETLAKTMLPFWTEHCISFQFYVLRWLWLWFMVYPNLWRYHFHLSYSFWLGLIIGMPTFFVYLFSPLPSDPCAQTHFFKRTHFSAHINLRFGFIEIAYRFLCVKSIETSWIDIISFVHFGMSA